MMEDPVATSKIALGTYVRVSLSNGWSEGVLASHNPNGTVLVLTTSHGRYIIAEESTVTVIPDSNFPDYALTIRLVRELREKLGLPRSIAEGGLTSEITRQGGTPDESQVPVTVIAIDLIGGQAVVRYIDDETTKYALYAMDNFWDPIHLKDEMEASRVVLRYPSMLAVGEDYSNIDEAIEAVRARMSD